MTKKSVQEIEQTAISEIAMLIGEFSELVTGSIVGNRTGVLDTVEEDWIKLRRATEKVYQRMVSELTDTINERDMIAKKKRNGESGA
jgi:hypothetical protein